MLRRRHWENWRGQVLGFILVSGVAPVAFGVLVPLGAVAWWVWWRNSDWLGHIPTRRREPRPARR